MLDRLLLYLTEWRASRRRKKREALRLIMQEEIEDIITNANVTLLNDLTIKKPEVIIIGGSQEARDSLLREGFESRLREKIALGLDPQLKYAGHSARVKELNM